MVILYYRVTDAYLGVGHFFLLKLHKMPIINTYHTQMWNLNNLFKIQGNILRTTGPILSLFVLILISNAFHAESKYGNKNLNFEKILKKSKNFHSSSALDIFVVKVNKNDLDRNL